MERELSSNVFVIYSFLIRIVLLFTMKNKREFAKKYEQTDKIKENAGAFLGIVAKLGEKRQSCNTFT